MVVVVLLVLLLSLLLLLVLVCCRCFVAVVVVGGVRQSSSSGFRLSLSIDCRLLMIQDFESERPQTADDTVIGTVEYCRLQTAICTLPMIQDTVIGTVS